jgi:hypothetical protein
MHFTGFTPPDGKYPGKEPGEYKYEDGTPGIRLIIFFTPGPWGNSLVFMKQKSNKKPLDRGDGDRYDNRGQNDF